MVYQDLMNNDYEFRRAPGKSAIWLSALGVVMLFGVVMIMDADHLTWVAWTAATVTLAWMFLPKPIYGIKIDDEYLVLAAWRKPKYVRLEEIAYLRATDVSDETNIAIVYRSGDEEGIFAADLPDVDTLVAVLGERGVPVRDVY